MPAAAPFSAGARYSPARLIARTWLVEKRVYRPAEEYDDGIRQQRMAQ